MADQTQNDRSGLNGNRVELIVLLTIWWLWMPVGAFLIWLIKHFLFGGFGQQDQSYVLFLQAQFFPFGTPLRPAPLFFIWLFVGFVVSLIFVRGYHKHLGTIRRFKGANVFTLALVLLIVGSFSGAWNGMWNDDKAAARYYSQDSTFYTSSVNPPPSSLQQLVTGATRSSGACDYVGDADMPSCLRVASMPDFDFGPRTASLAAAKTVMTDSSSLASGVDVMTATIHYLPTAAGGQGAWTTVLDGSGTRSIEGVAIWDGQSNTASICEFQGDDFFDRAFAGIAGNSLGNLLASTFPALSYVASDIVGYCDGTGPDAKPVIVIPVERQIGWVNRTVMVPSGVIVLRGSPNGHPDMTYEASVKPGEFPCQVYPESIAVTQVADLDWAAGRGNKDDAGFGYQVASISSNSANTGQYVLRSATDGHLYFVTPLTPRNSSSQAVVAYAVERADQASGGLNPLSVYVAADNTDPVSMSVIEARMTSFVNDNAPGLLTSGSGGQLEEIIPFGQGRWRGFVDVNGVTEDYIDVSGDAAAPPSLVVLPGYGSGSGSGTGSGAGTGSGPGSGATQAPPTAGTTPPAGSGTTDCGADPSTLTTAQITQCIQQLATQLNQREQAPAPTASPSS
ncbi:MAG TPA: hypothetical protein VGX23_07655 [Actinocrinis sp.]|nr:hypothetical protein [Actinocrinis sp.]